MAASELHSRPNAGAMRRALPPLACCLACREPVAIAATSHGKVLPLELDAAPAGLVAVPVECGGGPPVVRYLWHGALPGRGEWRAMAHVETCRARQAGRKRAARRAYRAGKHAPRGQ